MRLLATARKPGDIAATIKRGDYFVPVPDSEATWRGVRPTVR